MKSTLTPDAEAILARLDLTPEARETYAHMPLPQRAWALCKAAYEVAHEVSMAEQNTKLQEMEESLAASDPEPKTKDFPENTTREQRLAGFDAWKMWSARHPELSAACDAIIARHRVCKLEKLYQLAEEIMVEWAKEQMEAKFADRFTSVAILFEKYSTHELWGDMKKRFLELCFNCPAA